MSELVSLRVVRRGPVAEVALCGPGKGNALGPDFWRETPGVFAELDADPQVRAVLVHGGDGPAFSYGLDLPAMGGLFAMGDGGLAGARAVLLDQIADLQRAFDSVETCRKPVVAAVHGWCIGGGVDLVAACDIRLASADARFSVREVRVAIVADLGSLQRLPRLIGEGHARRLALTGEDVGAARAAQIGLVSEVLPDRDQLLVSARALTDRLADLPPLALQGTKQVLNDTRDLSLAAGLRHVAVWNSAFLASHDLGEALAAFAERRDPHFEGR
ncbi:MAG: crotonase/enoyl-CoA hydratase family protein [Mycobacteriales bacterium]